MTIQNNVFDLTQEQEDLSKMMYNGKILKCLVAPYHTYDELKKVVPFTKSTYLFPEREMNSSQVSSFISMVVNSTITTDIIIITTHQNIITDMVNQCVRILTEGGDIVECPQKTFAANIHDIRYYVLENPAHRLSKSEKNVMKESINHIIEQINSGNSMSRSDYNTMVSKIDLIGEPIIKNKLKEMSRKVQVL